jgi:serine/threonine protein phosphatase PrpC
MSNSGITWSSAIRTDVGKIRKLNEDSCLERPDLGLWAVADGMGGHAAGDLASQLVVNSLAKVKANGELSALTDFVEYSILSANNRLFELSQAQNQTTGSTVVCLLAVGKHCVCLWAGDSRLYRLRDHELRQMTTDHTQAELYVEQGLIDREQAARHPSGNMVTRAVGASRELFLDIDIDELRPGDRYLLSSDGLDKHVGPAEIEAIMKEGTPGEIADRLIELTLSRGAADNVTVCVVNME